MYWRKLITKYNHPFENLRGNFVGVRSRILVWYFLLTAGVTFISVHATYKIFCNSTQQELTTELERDVTSFTKLVEQEHKSNPQPINSQIITRTLDQFFSKQVPNPDRHLLVIFNGQILHPSPPERAYFIGKNQAKIQNWINSQQSSQKSSHQASRYQANKQPNSQLDGYLMRVIAPLQINGQSPGVIIAFHDATMRYQMAEMTLRIVMQVTLIGLILFSAIAWLTAGRALAPLRNVTETARSISESDLTQRLSVRGQDEIAELTVTFNQMLDRLQAAFTSQQDFIKDVSHELRTPITIISGHLELLGDDPEERRETIALVRDELKRMNQFVTDLLLLMRIERPNFLRTESHDLTSFTQELFSKAQGLAARNWQLEAVGTGEIVCDRQRITQAVLNLSHNAVQYTRAGDIIAIGSTNLDNKIQFWVRDTGEGIAIEDRERIFDRFARGKNSERRSEGSGLGLSIVQAIIKAHHGHIDLHSRLGEGSTFTITLPARQS